MILRIKSIFAKTKDWIIDHQNDIILIAGVILISLLSFAMGYIFAKQQDKPPIKFEIINQEKRSASIFQGIYRSAFNFSGVASLASSGSLAQYPARVVRLGRNQANLPVVLPQNQPPRSIEKVLV